MTHCCFCCVMEIPLTLVGSQCVVVTAISSVMNVKSELASLWHQNAATAMSDKLLLPRDAIMLQLQWLGIVGLAISIDTWTCTWNALSHIYLDVVDAGMLWSMIVYTSITVLRRFFVSVAVISILCVSAPQRYLVCTLQSCGRLFVLIKLEASY